MRDILIISTRRYGAFCELLGDGRRWGIDISYAVQPSPDGLAQAFLIGKEFIGDQASALVLGDNIFYGQGFSRQLQAAAQLKLAPRSLRIRLKTLTLRSRRVRRAGKAISLEEKPHTPSRAMRSRALFLRQSVTEIAASLKPSPRGELEITDLNRKYLKPGTSTLRS